MTSSWNSDPLIRLSAIRGCPYPNTKYNQLFYDEQTHHSTQFKSLIPVNPSCDSMQTS